MSAMLGAMWHAESRQPASGCGLSSQQEAQFQQLAAGALQPERVDEHVVDNALIRMVHAH